MSGILVELETRAKVIGGEIMLKAIENNDAQKLHSVKMATMAILETGMQVVRERLNYIDWRNTFIESNLQMNVLDDTGELTRLFQQMKQLDLKPYYLENVVPLFSLDQSELLNYINMVRVGFDLQIEMVRAERRKQIRIVH